MSLVPLAARSVLRVSGPDHVRFLQGLVSNDVTQAMPGQAVWAALLTPQGKYLADFFIYAEPGGVLLDVEAALADDIAQRLRRFRLRAQVDIAMTDWSVYAALTPFAGAPSSCIAAPDPRLPDAGWRLLSPTPLAAEGSWAAWDVHRLERGLPDGTRDMERERTVLLEAGFDELHGISWTKGCYMGQELTARTRYRGLLKRRLMPVRANGAVPPPSTPVLADGQEVGAMRSGCGGSGLALLRLDAMDAALIADGVSLVVGRPDWMQGAT